MNQYFIYFSKNIKIQQKSTNIFCHQNTIKCRYYQIIPHIMTLNQNVEYSLLLI